MIDKISDAKKLLEKTKHNYFESSKDVVEQEEKIIKLSEKNKIKEDEMIHLRDNLVKLQKKSEGECENYKKELEKINNFFEEYEKKYNELIGTFQQDEEYKLNFVLIHFAKLHQIFSEEQKNKKEFCDYLDSSIHRINIKRGIMYNNI